MSSEPVTTPLADRLTTTAALATGIALATLAAAWGFEIVGGYVPCKLCLQERIPYYVGVPIAGAALVAALSGASGVSRLLLVAAALTFIVGAGLGLYHAGAEWAWWPGPADCGATGGHGAGTAAELLQQLETIRIVSCTEATWRFPQGWGLSFAGWNAAISVTVAAVALYGAAAGRKPAYGSSSVSQ